MATYTLHIYNSTKHAIISVKEYIIPVLPEYRNSV